MALVTAAAVFTPNSMIRQTEKPAKNEIKVSVLPAVQNNAFGHEDEPDKRGLIKKTIEAAR
jgi:hypothetical protein